MSDGEKLMYTLAVGIALTLVVPICIAYWIEDFRRWKKRRRK